MIRHFLLLFGLALSPLRAEEFALRDGDTVAFLGDSITAARNYSKVIEDYTLMRFPDRKVRFINAGKGGETAQLSLARLDDAVIAKGATVLTVAYGVNDIGWGMKADAEHRQAYLDGISEIIERCHARNIRVFICSPAITAERPETAETGFLQQMCDAGLALAKSKQAGTIDVMRAMRSVQRRIADVNAKEADRSKHTSLHAADGVHLNDLGQMAMAWAMLKGLGAPADVSWAEVDAANRAVVRQEDCLVSDITSTEEGLVFTRLDQRLPLNQQPLWMLHGWFIPITEELNRYGLSVQHLPAGKYDLFAGGRKLGAWSETDFASGINLASATADPWEPGGPWHGQGQLLSTLTMVRDELDWANRGLGRYLTAHPGQAGLSAKMSAIENNVIELQREMARPAPVKFEIRKSMEDIRLSPDGKSFALMPSGKPFRVWGVNYDHDSEGENGRLLEDYWEKEWDTVRSDFQEMKDLGANVVRIHLQLGKFMNTAEAPNPRSLARLQKLLDLAEHTGLYLDLTGLGCYHKAESPAWYDALNETERWQVQARFWAAVARACRESKAIFCYDLMNEPVIDGKKDQGWVTGELGGYSFVQRLTLDPGQRTQIEIARAWVEQMTTAIRKEDPHHLLTVGVIPWAMVWPNAKPVFYAPEVQGMLDFVSIHVYPKKGEVDKALAAMAVYDIGKPLVIEETFPLSCGFDDMDDFLKRSRDRAEGYVSFYWGRTRAQYALEKDKDMKAAIMAQWLEKFQNLAPSMKQP